MGLEAKGLWEDGSLLTTLVTDYTCCGDFILEFLLLLESTAIWVDPKVECSSSFLRGEPTFKTALRGCCVLGDWMHLADGGCYLQSLSLEE